MIELITAIFRFNHMFTSLNVHHQLLYHQTTRYFVPIVGKYTPFCVVQNLIFNQRVHNFKICKITEARYFCLGNFNNTSNLLRHTHSIILHFPIHAAFDTFFQLHVHLLDCTLYSSLPRHDGHDLMTSLIEITLTNIPASLYQCDASHLSISASAINSSSRCKHESGESITFLQNSCYYWKNFPPAFYFCIKFDKYNIIYLSHINMIISSYLCQHWTLYYILKIT